MLRSGPKEGEECGVREMPAENVREVWVLVAPRPEVRLRLGGQLPAPSENPRVSSVQDQNRKGRRVSAHVLSLVPVQLVLDVRAQLQTVVPLPHVRRHSVRTSQLRHLRLFRSVYQMALDLQVFAHTRRMDTRTRALSGWVFYWILH